MNISSLAQGVTAATGLGGLILATARKNVGYQPQDFPSYVKSTENKEESFLFHYEGENSVTLTSDITDHVIENNEVINDQISLKPEMITTQGFIGDLNDVTPYNLEPLKQVAQKLVPIGAFAPQLSTTALIAYNDALTLYRLGLNAKNSAIGAINSINGDGLAVLTGTLLEGELRTQKSQTPQQLAFQKFYGYWKNRNLFTIQTPWAIFKDCAIQSIHATQDAETRMVSGFDVTFKVLRFAETKVIARTVFAQTSQGRATGHAAIEQDQGAQNLTPSETTFSSVAR